MRPDIGAASTIPIGRAPSSAAAPAPPRSRGLDCSFAAHLSTAHSSSLGLDRRDRADDFLCGDNGAGVVRDVDVERGMHLFIRVIRRRVFYHRDLVAELSGVANGRFDAGMCYQSDHNELMDAVLFE